MQYVEKEEVRDLIKQARITNVVRTHLLDRLDELHTESNVEARFHYIVHLTALYKSTRTHQLQEMDPLLIEYVPNAEDIKTFRENAMKVLTKAKTPSPIHSLHDVLVTGIERKEGSIREAELRKELEEEYRKRFERWKEDYEEEGVDDSSDIL